MINNSMRAKCDVSGDIVAYLYDELGIRERAGFESHLVDCTACTDEFADISYARYSVYEWHKEEFVPMETPEIVIPYTLTADVRPGFFAGLRDLITAVALPQAATAVLVLGISIGAVVLMFRGTEQQALVNSGSDAVTMPAVEAIDDADQAENVKPSVTRDRTIDTVISSDKPAVPVTVKAATKKQLRRPRVEAPVRTRNLIDTTADGVAERRALTANAAPSLSSYDEFDDGSLRLADLFEDGGS